MVNLGKKSLKIVGILVSPDGKTIAAWIKDKKGVTIAVNGKPWEGRFEDCRDPRFSPDGEKIMVVVRKEGKYYRLVREV